MRNEIINFVSDYEKHEEKTINWEIKNIRRFIQLPSSDMKNAGITFDAGHSIGVPATWYFFLYSNDQNLVVCLKLKNAVGFKVVNADFSVTFKDGTTIIWEGKLNQVYGFGECSLTTNPTVPSIRDILSNQSNLEVIVQIKVYESAAILPVMQKAEATPSKQDMENFQQKLSQDLSKLLVNGDGDGYDLVIKIMAEKGSKEVLCVKEAHKIILAARSPVFASMFDPKTNMLEVQEGKLKIFDLSPTGLNVLLEYIYTGNVSEEWKQVPEEVFNAAEKYNLPELKKFCGENLSAVITDKNVIEIYKFAELHNLTHVQDEIVNVLKRTTTLEDWMNLYFKVEKEFNSLRLTALKD